MSMTEDKIGDTAIHQLHLRFRSLWTDICRADTDKADPRALLADAYGLAEELSNTKASTLGGVRIKIEIATLLMARARQNRAPTFAETLVEEAMTELGRTN